MKIVFMGTPQFSVPILEALNDKYEVLLVVTQPDKPEGRKRILTMSPVKEKALELGIKVFQPIKIKDDYEEIMSLDADVLVTAAYGQFVPTKVLKHFKKCINVHGSLLPKRRGGAPIQRSIMEGDSVTGVTIMEMVKQMDAGRMYAVCECPILDEDNNTSMFNKLSIMGRDLLLSCIEDIYNEKNLGIPQNELEATISPNIAPCEEKISFKNTAKDIWNQIRGLAMEPGAYFMVNNSRVKVYEAKLLADYYKNPGTVIETKKHLIIQAKDGALELLTIKPEGKKIMKASDFLNGQKLINIGDILD